MSHGEFNMSKKTDNDFNYENPVETPMCRLKTRHQCFKQITRFYRYNLLKIYYK